TALLKGKGGSMHMCSPDQGFMGTSAIVAGIIPVAIGVAWANKQHNNGKVVAVFFGDGAVDEGDFWESLNSACLMKLPVLFVCEDNGLAVHTPVADRHGYKSITDIVARFNCNVLKADTTDVEVIHKLARKAVDLIKKTGMPCFMHLRYYRYLEHVGVGEDFDAGYRSRADYEEWFNRDPVRLQRNTILNRRIASEQELSKVETGINIQLDDSIRKAKEAPFAETKELYFGVFA
ncbi:MAG: thiamine pyrophosphate-dependent enzyme, partial [Bacteroidia bacterium]|nr:thiamine pyrophosphate-dependent enzyme [Bacteroidia bacterium]